MFWLLLGSTLALHVAPITLDAPAREPQMAVSGRAVGLTFGAGKGIYFSASADSGKTFSGPVKVAEAEVVALNRHRGPRIAMRGRTVVITAVMGRTPAQGQHAHGLAADGDLIAWRSADGGRSWSQGVRVNDVKGAPTEGLHSLAMDSKGNLFAAWLDKRGGQGTRLYGARSIDGGLTWSKNTLIYESPEGTICECCHPSIAIDSEGMIAVMFRNWLGGSRDMYVARSHDGATFSKPEKLGVGTWQLNACPMDGGGMVVDHNHLVTAWRREHEIFLDRPGEMETSLGEGTDVSIAAAGDHGVYAVWSTPAGVRVLEPGRKQTIGLASKGGFPNIIAFPDGGALAAWEDDGGIQLQAIP